MHIKEKIILLVAGSLLTLSSFLIRQAQTPTPTNQFGATNVTRPCQTASATTSPFFIQAGKATTTLACDTFGITGDPSKGNVADSANLAIFMSGSSTASLLDINIEYSNDNIDWYQSAISERATTSPQLNGVVQNFRFQFASTTAGLPIVAGTQATTTRMFTIPTPTRYVRAVFTVPVGSPASAVWAEMTLRKQQ